MKKKPVKKSTPDLNDLKKKIALAKRKSKKPVIGRTNLSPINMFRLVEANNLQRIANNTRSQNSVLAKKLLEILKKSQKGEIVADEAGFSADHRTLTRILVKINAFERQSKKVVLTPLEKKVFERYSGLI